MSLLVGALTLMSGCSTVSNSNTAAPLTKGNCKPAYKAQTLDKTESVVMCADPINVLFAYGNNASRNPEILFSAPINKIQIRTYTKGMKRVGYDVLVPKGTNSWMVISDRPDGIYLKSYNGKVNLGNIRKTIDGIKGVSILPDAKYNKLMSLKGPLVLEGNW